MADRTSGIERVGIENLLIRFATRAAGRLIAWHCDGTVMTLIACPLALGPGGPAGPAAPGGPTGPAAPGGPT
ncbi:MAG: hypothetical protein WA707_19945, partial [Pseudolabrys sp.]